MGEAVFEVGVPLVVDRHLVGLRIVVDAEPVGVAEAVGQVGDQFVAVLEVEVVRQAEGRGERRQLGRRAAVDVGA